MTEEATEDLKVLEIIKKHTYNDSWSNGYCTRYWEMTKDELKLIKKWFDNGCNDKEE